MNSLSSRRKFFRQLSIGGSAFIMTPALLKAASFGLTAAQTLNRVGGVLPVAVVEDCFDLAFTLPNMSTTTKIALAGDIDLKISGNKGRLAPYVTFSKAAMLAVLDKIKGAQGDTKTLHHDKLSYLLGILSNQVLHQYLLPVYEQYPDEVAELSMYQDTYLLRTLAGSQGNEVKQEDLDQLLKVLLPRTITRVHTLIPDSQDGPDWVVKMGQWRKENQKLMEQYARAYTHPDPEKEKRYLTDINFYNAEDALIRQCRTLQAGERVAALAIRDSIDASLEQGSLYAQVLANAVHRIQTVDAYLKDSLDGQQLWATLKV